MKKFFLHELKKSAFPVGVIALIATAIYVTTALTATHDHVVKTNIGTIAFIGGALAMLVPIWVFAYRMNKRSVDLYYALPLKRVEVLAVRYLIGLIAVMLPFTVAYWIGALTTYVRVMEQHALGMRAIYYIPYYFSALGAMLCLYSISSFAYTRANRVIDGILFILFWMLALYALMSLVSMFVGASEPGTEYPYFDTKYFIYSGFYAPTSPLDTATEWFNERLASNSMMNGYVVYDQYRKVNMIVGFIVTGLCAVGANVLLFLGEKKARAENVGQVSESPFGFLVMIPLFTVCLIGIASSVPLTVIIIIASYALSAVYRHTLKIGVRQGIILAAASVVGIALMIIYSYCVNVGT